MAYQRAAKVIFGGETLIDLTDSTVTASDLRDGVIAYDKTGGKITGSLDSDVTVTNFSGTVTLISGDDYKLTITN